MASDRKKEIYKWVKIAGLISFLPFVLASGPMAGYFLGDYLEKSFHLTYAPVVGLLIGIAGSAMETVRIIKFALKAEEKK